MRARTHVKYWDIGEEDDDDDKYFEIEKIIGHKEENGRMLYLIKWHQFDESFNSWISVDDFSTPDLSLHEYYSEAILSAKG